MAVWIARDFECAKALKVVALGEPLQSAIRKILGARLVL